MNSDLARTSTLPELRKGHHGHPGAKFWGVCSCASCESKDVTMLSSYLYDTTAFVTVNDDNKHAFGLRFFAHLRAEVVIFAGAECHLSNPSFGFESSSVPLSLGSSPHDPSQATRFSQACAQSSSQCRP